MTTQDILPLLDSRGCHTTHVELALILAGEHNAHVMGL